MEKNKCFHDCEALLGFKPFFKMRNRIKNIRIKKQGTTQHQSISGKGRKNAKRRNRNKTGTLKIKYLTWNCTTLMNTFLQSRLEAKRRSGNLQSAVSEVRMSWCWVTHMVWSLLYIYARSLLLFIFFSLRRKIYICEWNRKSCWSYYVPQRSPFHREQWECKWNLPQVA